MSAVLPERVAKLMKKRGLTQSALARLTGVKQPSINSVIMGRTLKPRFLHEIAQALGTSTSYLVGEIDDPDEGAELPTLLAEQLGMRMIPDVDIAYSMGGGSLVDEYVSEKRVPFRQDWLDRALRGRPSDVFLTRGDGDSMLPTILDGDDVLVNRAENVIDRQDRIWALGYGELAQIKRVRRLPSGMFQLNSDNPVVSPIEASEDELHVVGRVVWIGRKM